MARKPHPILAAFKIWWPFILSVVFLILHDQGIGGYLGFILIYLFWMFVAPGMMILQFCVFLLKIFNSEKRLSFQYLLSAIGIGFTYWFFWLSLPRP